MINAQLPFRQRGIFHASELSTQPHRIAFLIVFLGTLLHVMVAGRVGLGSDEAHYALYGLHLDWSYFDHPPMVGWMQALVLTVSDHNFALRLVPMALFVLNNFLLYRLARILFPEQGVWLGVVVVALFNLAIMFHLIGISMLPEDPLLTAGLLVMLSLHRIVKQSGENTDWFAWIMLGASMGLAGLSKYTAVTLVVTVVWVLYAQGRIRVLMTPVPWIAVLIALAMISPVLYWNATHDWISFRYQLEHGFKSQDWEIKRALLTQGAQFAAYTPGIYIAGLIALFVAWRDRAHTGVQMTWALVLPVFLLFFWGSGHKESLPHWTALAWTGALPLTGRWFMQHWTNRSVRILGWSIPIIALPLVLVIFAEFFEPWMPVKDNRHPFRALYGWEVAAPKAIALRDEWAHSSGTEPKLVAGNWSLGSRFAWHARPNAIHIADDRYDQFDLWFGELKAGDSAIFVRPTHFKAPQTGDEKGRFRECEERERLPHRVKGRLITTFVFYRCIGFNK